jgi:acyl-CoA synthetase (AMP-forming)/AMP-acid ligase II/acyl carrier protein
VFFAGEPLTESLVRRWREAFPEAGKIVNLYGPTETTLAKCYFQVPDQLPPGIQPVGSPLPETQALVLQPNGQLCGMGEPGEIVIRTPFRSLGYLNAREENQRAFFKNPFREDPHDVLYRTGDRGRYRPDRLLEILGRLDDQLKIRGVRIEPGEIAAVLEQHASVRQVFVMAHEENSHRPASSHSSGKRLVAYVVPVVGHVPTTGELRDFLQVRMPNCMVPSQFVMLNGLPLTPNGKVDRRALPVSDADVQLERAYVAPRTPVEQVLAQIWCEVLQLQCVGIHDNFFALGGHSLAAARVVARLRSEFSTDVPLAALFAQPTLAELSVAITQHLAAQISDGRMDELLKELEA